MATATVAATDLRAELKEWERAFAAANGDRKAGRLDIKNNPDIAAKYKTYGKLKGQELASGKQDKHDQTGTTLEERPKKRKHTSPTGTGHEPNDNISTPRKSTKGIFETPSQPRTVHPSQLDPYDSPTALRRLFSPSTHQSQTPLKTAVGPTPQRDGKALGLFDLLSESGGSTATPTANRLASVREAAVQTPSRQNRMESIMEENEEEEQEEETPRGGRTPASSGKKWYLANLFATPTTLRYAAMVEDEEERKPADPNNQAAAADSKGAAGQGETPSFLRRSNAGRSFNALDTSTAGLSPIAARKPPQFVGKGLSALVQGLRDMEEERLDDDMDVLREIEADQEAMENNDVDVADSQNPTDNAGRPPYKKRGQKRTTRRVRMKPVVVSKAQTNPSDPVGGDTDEEVDGDELASAVPNTQLPEETADQVPEEDEHDDDASLAMSEPKLDDSDPDYDQPVTKTKSFSEKMKEAISADSKNQPQKDSQSTEKQKPKTKTKGKDQEKEQESRPRARKINPNANAHANFRSLKIGTRGRGRGTGRFRRR